MSNTLIWSPQGHHQCEHPRPPPTQELFRPAAPPRRSGNTSAAAGARPLVFLPVHQRGRPAQAGAAGASCASRESGADVPHVCRSGASHIRAALTRGESTSAPLSREAKAAWRRRRGSDASRSGSAARAIGSDAVCHGSDRLRRRLSPEPVLPHRSLFRRLPLRRRGAGSLVGACAG
jgi:hypothetical protein